jgi:Protein of unknown function (DUF2384)
MKPQRIHPGNYTVRVGASAGECQDRLRAAAAMFFADKERAAVFLHSSNPRLGGSSPSEYAVTSVTLAAAIAVLQPAKRARRRGGGLL